MNREKCGLLRSPKWGVKTDFEVEKGELYLLVRGNKKKVTYFFRSRQVFDKFLYQSRNIDLAGSLFPLSEGIR